MPVHLADEQDRDVDTDDLFALATSVLEQRRVPPEMELSVLLVDPATIAVLNAEHLGNEGPTDVLAFPIDLPGATGPDEGPPILGDVVLCPAVAHQQAADLGRTPQDEVRMLVVHGILHLLGMDHDTPEREREMFGLTDRLLDAYASASASAGDG